MLKRKIKKADFDALDPKIQFEYKKEGDDSYVLDTDDAKDLMAARDAEKREKEEIKAQLETTKKELNTIKASNSNWETMETSYKTRIAGLEADVAAANTTVTQMNREKHTSAVADKIAARFTAPGLIKKEILARLDVDPKDNSKVIVLDAAGKASAFTPQDLEKEFVDNPEYKAIVVAHKGSGSAGAGLPVVPGSTASDPNTPKKTIAQMKPAEVVEHRRAQKAAAAQAQAGGAA